MCASHWVLHRPKGAMKVKVGFRRPRWDPGPRPRHTNGSSTSPRRPGEARAYTLRPERW